MTLLTRTVREAALEQEVAALRNENAELRHRLARAEAHNCAMWVYDNKPPPVAEKVLPLPVPTTLRLAAVFEATKDSAARYHLIGKGRGKDGAFGYSYFVSEEQLLSAHDVFNLMGHLHERCLRQLADLYRKA